MAHWPTCAGLQVSADFRRHDRRAIRKVCRQFVMLCRDVKLFTQAVVAIDGSKFKAVNSRDRNFTPTKIDRRIEQFEESVQRYLDALEIADRTQPVEVEAKTKRLTQKIDRLRQLVRELTALKAELETREDPQVSATDPDPRSMIINGGATGAVGYPPSQLSGSTNCCRTGGQPRKAAPDAQASRRDHRTHAENLAEVLEVLPVGEGGPMGHVFSIKPAGCRDGEIAYETILADQSTVVGRKTMKNFYAPPDPTDDFRSEVTPLRVTSVASPASCERLLHVEGGVALHERDFTLGLFAVGFDLRLAPYCEAMDVKWSATAASRATARSCALIPAVLIMNHVA